VHNNEVNYLIIIITSSSQTVRSFALIFYTYISWVKMVYCNPAIFCGHINFAVFAVASGPQN
jgi:hypothetical protein